MNTRLRTVLGLPLLASAVTLAVAVPYAGASGESASAVLGTPAEGTSATFSWTYTFHQNDGHALSNVAIGFCSDDVVSHVVSASPDATIYTSGDVGGGHTGFGPGIKFGVTGESGVLTVVFDQAYGIAPAGLRIQSHSGDGQTGDETLTAAGPDACPSETPPPGDDTTPPGDDDTPPGDETVPPGDDTTPPSEESSPPDDDDTDPVTTESEEEGTEVLGLLLENADTPAPAVTLVNPVVTPAVTPAVTGKVAPAAETAVDPIRVAELPRTGSTGTQPLAGTGFGALIVGLACRAFSRRRSVSTVR